MPSLKAVSRGLQLANRDTQFVELHVKFFHSWLSFTLCFERLSMDNMHAVGLLIDSVRGMEFPEHSPPLQYNLFRVITLELYKVEMFNRPWS